jgi:hypothetical protein
VSGEVDDVSVDLEWLLRGLEQQGAGSGSPSTRHATGTSPGYQEHLFR